MEAVLLQARDGEVLAKGDVRGELGTQLENLIDLEVQDLLGQPVLRDAVAEHPSGLRHRLEHVHLVPLDGEVVGTRQPGRPRTHDGDFLAVRRRDLGPEGLRLAEVEIGDVALDVVDSDGLVEHPAAAPLDLARAGADATADRWERVGLLDQAERVCELPERRKGNVPLDVHAGGAGELTGPDAVGVVVGQQQLERGLARAQDLRAPRLDDHSAGHLRGARGQERAGALDLDDAQVARGKRLELLVVAQRRDVVDAVISGHLQDGLRAVRDDALSVDFELHKRHWSISRETVHS